MLTKKGTLVVLLLFLLLFLAACGGGENEDDDTADSGAGGGIIVLGDISDEPAETIEGTQPMADYLAEHLSDFGISRGEVKIAPDLDTMIEWVETGEVDIYFDSPYPVLVISDETGATPILRRFRFGVEEYHSVFFVRADSPIESLDELSGQIIAFEESFSTSGYMLPLSYLIEQDYNPVLKSNPDAAVAGDEMGYVFSTADNTTIQWVVSGIVPAGVIDNVTFGRLPEETQAELKIIEATEDVPRQMVLVRPGMDADLQAAIHDVLLAMDEDEAGQAALDVFQTTEFADFAEGPEVALRRMRELFDLVRGA